MMSTQSIHSRLRNLLNAERAPLVALALFSAVSYSTTFQGVYAVFERLSLDSANTALVLAVLGASGIQLLVAWGAWCALRAGPWSRRVFALSIYLCAMSLSVGFSYAFYFELLRGDDYSTSQYLERVGTVTRAAMGFESAYGSLVQHLEHLSAHSSTIAEHEIAEGGTCGDDSPPSDGPRARLRRADARTLDGFLPHFRRRHAEIRALVSDMRVDMGEFRPRKQAQFVARARDAVARLAVWRGDPTATQLRTWVSERIELGRSGFGYEGGRFTCPDPVLEQLGRSVLAQTLPAPPTLEQDWFDASNRHDAIELAFARLFVLAASTLEADAAVPIEAGGFARSRDWVPLGAGVVVDVLILLSTCAAAARSRNSTHPADWQWQALSHETPRFAPPLLARMVSYLGLPHGRMHPAHALYQGLAELALSQGKHYYLVQPINGPHSPRTRRWSERQRAIDLLRELGELRLVDPATDTLPSSLRGALAPDEQDAPHFEVHRFNAHLMRTLMLDGLRVGDECMSARDPEDETDAFEDPGDDDLDDDDLDGDTDGGRRSGFGR